MGFKLLISCGNQFPESGETMACYFTLYIKGTNERVPSLQQVDDELRAHFGVEPDPNEYASWYGCIGFLIALGKGDLGSESLRNAIREWHFPTDWRAVGNDNVRAQERYDCMILQLAYLEERYSSDGWTQIGGK